VGIYFGAPGQQVRPLFRRHLWFAEKASAQVLPEHEVVDIRLDPSRLVFIDET